MLTSQIYCCSSQSTHQNSLHVTPMLRSYWTSSGGSTYWRRALHHATWYHMDHLSTLTFGSMCCWSGESGLFSVTSGTLGNFIRTGREEGAPLDGLRPLQWSWPSGCCMRVGGRTPVSLYIWTIKESFVPLSMAAVTIFRSICASDRWSHLWWHWWHWTFHTYLSTLSPHGTGQIWSLMMRLAAFISALFTFCSPRSFKITLSIMPDTPVIMVMRDLVVVSDVALLWKSLVRPLVVGDPPTSVCQHLSLEKPKRIILLHIQHFAHMFLLVTMYTSGPCLIHPLSIRPFSHSSLLTMYQNFLTLCSFWSRLRPKKITVQVYSIFISTATHAMFQNPFICPYLTSS